MQLGDHSIAKAPNELEVALSIASFYRMQPEGQKDLKKAVAQAAASVPPCKAYIKSVGDFVANFAGGESFELLKYLDYIGASAAWKPKASKSFCFHVQVSV